MNKNFLFLLMAAPVLAQYDQPAVGGYNWLSPGLILLYIVIGGVIYYLIYRRMKKKGKKY